MTVIAYDGRTLAADKLSESGHVLDEVTKIKRIGRLRVAICGDFRHFGAYCKWVEDGRKVADFPVSKVEPTGNDAWTNFIVIEEDASVSAYEGEPYPLKFKAPYAAGCGKQAARMAMQLGLPAAEAVLETSRFVHGCGMGVDKLDPMPIQVPPPQPLSDHDKIVRDWIRAEKQQTPPWPSNFPLGGQSLKCGDPRPTVQDYIAARKCDGI